MKTRIVIAAAIAAALVVGSPAAAKPKKPGTFRLEIKGEQLTTWNYQKEMEPQCDFPEYASGSQYIQFETYDTGDAARPKVTAKAAKGGGVELAFVRDDITISAQAELERNYDVLYSQISDCPDGDAGGDSGNQDARGTDRCEARGSLDVYLGASIGEVESPSYPTDLTDEGAPKAPLYFGADPWWLGSDASDHNLPAACAAEGQPNADIGIVESQGEWAGAVIPVVASLPAKKLLDPKRRKTVIEFGRTVKYPNEVQTYGGPPHTTGQTRIDATFTFTRAR